MSQLLPYLQSTLQMNHILRHDLWHGWSAAEESRALNELWLVIGGGGYLNVDGRQYRLQPGDMCLLPDILPKENGCDIAEHFDVLILHFKASLLSAPLFEHMRCNEWVVHPAPEVFEEIFKLVSSCKFGYHYQLPTFEQVLRMNFALQAALDTFFSLTQTIEVQNDDWLSDTLHYIAEHYSEKLSIDALSHRVAMHPKHFARRFRERTGFPPGKYIADVRLKRAIQLLREGVHLQNISERIGFQNIQQFFRFFKQQTGMTPREYQKKHIKGEVQKQ